MIFQLFTKIARTFFRYTLRQSWAISARLLNVLALLLVPFVHVGLLYTLFTLPYQVGTHLGPHWAVLGSLLFYAGTKQRDYPRGKTPDGL